MFNLELIHLAGDVRANLAGPPYHSWNIVDLPRTSRPGHAVMEFPKTAMLMPDNSALFNAPSSINYKSWSRELETVDI